ncbi:MAG: glycosyltransferase family 39 protein [Thermoguttaceae bacterium]
MTPREIMTPRMGAWFFWTICLLNGLLWTLLPWWFQPSPATYDVTEAFVMAREWLMGTSKHPPLPFWALESVYQLTGSAHFSGYLIGQLWTTLGLWSVWKLSRQYVSESLALLVVIADTTYRYCNIGVMNYTTSVPVISLWCVSIYFFFNALRNNRKRDWFLLGISLGAGIMCKYSFAILIGTMIVYMGVFQMGRCRWKTPGPYLTTLVAFFMFLPHWIWVVQHDYPTIQTARDSVSSSGNWMGHLISPLEFGIIQPLLFLPILICLIPLTGFIWQLRLLPKHEQSPQKQEMNSFLSWMIGFPFLLHLLAAGIGGGHFRPAYGSPLWMFLGLWMLTHFYIDISARRMKQVVGLTFVITGIIILCYILNYQLFYFFTPNKGCRIHFPGKALAESVTQIWSEQSASPCPWISGDWKLAGHAAYNMKNRPRVLCYYFGCQSGQTTVNIDATDAMMNRDGGIVLWMEDEEHPALVPAWLYERYPRAHVGNQTLILPWQTTANPPPLRVQYAVIPPVTKNGETKTTQNNNIL